MKGKNAWKNKQSRKERKKVKIKVEGEERKQN